MENDYQIDGIQTSRFQQFMSNFVAKWKSHTNLTHPVKVF